jgi:hypothetical protein
MDSNPRSPAYDEFGASGRAHATHAAMVKPRKPIVCVGERSAARLAPPFTLTKSAGRFEIGFGDFEHYARHPAPPPKSPRPSGSSPPPRSPSSSRATNRRRSSITEHSFHGIHASPKGERCYPCVRYDLSPMSRAALCCEPNFVDQGSSLGGRRRDRAGSVTGSGSPRRRIHRHDLARHQACRRLQRGVFHSLADLQAAINRYLGELNRKPKPFVWTADPKRIIKKLDRGYQVLASDQ